MPSLIEHYAHRLNKRHSGILTCATSGRIVLNSHEGEILSNVSAHLPANLKDLRLSGDAKSFAIGGNEVDLCTWDLEQTLSSDGIEPLTANSTKKRKGKKNDLLPGETWRAQNVCVYAMVLGANGLDCIQVPNDNLDLRVPVHITSLCYLDRTKSTELMTGTSFGAVRRYDTRASRRPVADFSDVVKKSSIDRVQRGVSEQCAASLLEMSAADAAQRRIRVGQPWPIICA